MKTVSMFGKVVFLLFAFAVINSIVAESALAIPAFARKYRMSCKTCHVAAPYLKPYGDDFAGNGFELPDQEAPRYFVETGDDELNLIREFPVAVRMDGFVNYNDYSGKKADLETPYLLKLLSGGALDEHIAYYFYMYMDERGEVAGVEDAYIMFDDLLGADFDIYVGQFQISDPLFKRELRLTLEDYRVYTTTVGFSRKALKYDRGLMFTYGTDTGTGLAFEVLNGNGLAEADETHNFDDDKYKDVLGRVSQDFGDYFRAGAFFYHGRERMNGWLNRTWYYGPDFSVSSGDHRFELNFQYLMRTDDNPFFSATGARDLETQGGLVEAIIGPNGDESDFFLVGLFNWVDSDLDALDYQSITGHVTYMLKRNIRLAWEVSREFENENTRIGMGFVSAF